MSDKLLPCPFCGGEAMLEFTKERKGHGAAVACGCSANIYTVTLDTEAEAEAEAIAAWNRRAEPENKPLTLDELREMDGELVMVLSDITIMRMLQNSSLEYNVGTVKLHRHMYLDVYEDVIEYSGGTCSRLDDCGRNIVAYRFKPEEV